VQRSLCRSTREINILIIDANPRRISKCTNAKFCYKYISNTTEYRNEIERIPFITKIVLQIDKQAYMRVIRSMFHVLVRTRKPKAIIFRILSTVNSAVNVVLAYVNISLYVDGLR
jgi:hypothetical protein